MKKFLSLLLCFIILLHPAFNISAAESVAVTNAVEDLADYVYKTITEPQVGSVGGEWAIIGLARSGAELPPSYFDGYIRNVEDTLTSLGGVLHTKKYTEYSRVILALTALGKSPTNVAGYNLLTPLGDFEQTVKQGINGAIWALIALDSGNYEIPKNPSAKTQATREKYLEFILQKQLADGGFALSGENADADLTAMALQAMAKYTDKPTVKTSVNKALTCLAAMQRASGGFAAYGAENAESCAQVIVALCELGISPRDSRFVKSGNSPLDNLLTFYIKGKGFKHLKSDKSAGQMTTEQGLYALVAVLRQESGQNSLYRMGDVESRTGGLVGKHPDVKKLPVVAKKNFADTASHQNRAAIEALAARNVINGRSATHFYPNSGMTRAEFAAILVRGLGLPQNVGTAFADVKKSDWFYAEVSTACAYGIVKGVSATAFNPHGGITREEVAVMLARAAVLCGVSTDYTPQDVTNTLAAYPDYKTASEWAHSSLAFCYDRGIANESDEKISPKFAATRAEIAQMLYNLLVLSKLV